MNSFDALFNWKPQNGSGSIYVVCPYRRTRYLSFYFRASPWSLLYRRKPTNSNLFPNLKNWTEVYFLWETSILAALQLTDPVYVFKAPWGNKISITCGGGDTQSSFDCGAWYVLRRWWQGMRRKRWWCWGFRKWTEIQLIWSSICNWIHTTCISSVFKVFQCVSFSLHCLFHLIGSFRCRRQHHHHRRSCTTTWSIFTLDTLLRCTFCSYSAFVTQQLCDKTFTRTLEKSSIRGTKSRATAAPFTAAAGSTY